ncbi:1,4-alpha-glucan branching protein GlgB [Legionella worsleiensis]|uniref:1,4-alpha-glucan branching enzyme n=1 Tax=Legionella worsleiensis TaxID=45076 RepID=A0A0W1AFV9_9GAMM|nr:1,4-alpha-glucan branching protein GlgB [Legionella worsleiensis]KTD80225.1 1,4-alpha-glucan branching enzyme GlgB [Legionella worsleiensis]STY31695.1 1,4-alpha-glucan branching enzyme GlgB [Legionella worsleiensis]
MALPSWFPTNISMPTLNRETHLLFKNGYFFKYHHYLGAQQIGAVSNKTFSFTVYAPHAKKVSVIGDFNNWDANKDILTKNDISNLWEIKLSNVYNGQFYKFYIESEFDKEPLLKADPFAFWSENHPPHASRIFNINNFQWNDTKWLAKRRHNNPHKMPISIYECHLGSWLRDSNDGFLNYREISEHLIPYVKSLNYTHIELLPIMEHPYYPSWGYQTLGYFSPTSRYGNPEDFAYFIDACHQQGIGVILDWVPSHFPGDEHGLRLFDGQSIYEYPEWPKCFHNDWKSYIFNYGSPFVVNFLINSALLWLEKYHVDGLRVDAVSSMIYLDYSKGPGEWQPNIYGGNHNLEAIKFIQKLTTVLQYYHPDVLLFAEESTAFPKVTELVIHGGLGFDFKWNMGWMNDTLSYIQKTPKNRLAHEHDIKNLTSYHFHEKVVLPYSHDEVVHGKRSLLEKISGQPHEQFSTLKAIFAFKCFFPGKKLSFMGNELALNQEWHFNQQLQWDEYKDKPASVFLRKLICDLNTLYRHFPCLYFNEHEPNQFKWIEHDNVPKTCFVFMRKYEHENILIISNFGTEDICINNIQEDHQVMELILHTEWQKYGGIINFSSATEKNRYSSKLSTQVFLCKN